MTKLTEMCATARRAIARKHRVEANLVRIEKDKLPGFSPKYLKLSAKETFHTAQAKLWEAAAAHAEANGFVRLG